MKPNPHHPVRGSSHTNPVSNPLQADAVLSARSTPESEQPVNVDGKGLVPVLQELPGTALSHVKAKPAAELLGDYMVSLLILSAKFSFKPARGTSYYLYRRDHQWHLSLIAPEQWASQVSGVFVGHCWLRSDLTWTLTASDDVASNPELVDALTQFHRAFCDSLDTDAPLEEGLPFYASQLGFYQRALAHGMSVSLQKSMDASGLRSVAATHWLAQTVELRLPGQ